MAEILIYPRDEALRDPKALAKQATDLAEKFGRLPEDYLAFLKAYGGGFPWPANVPLANKVTQDRLGSSRITIAEFYRPDVVTQYADGEIYTNNLPTPYVFVADLNGFHLIMGLAPEDLGKLYIWRPNGVDWGEPGNNAADLDLIAQSFTDLIAMMTDLMGPGPARRVWDRGLRRSEARKIEV